MLSHPWTSSDTFNAMIRFRRVRPSIRAPCAGVQSRISGGPAPRPARTPRCRESDRSDRRAALFAIRPAVRVLDQKISHSLEFGQKCLGNRLAGMLGIVGRRIAKLGFCARMQPVAQAMRALIRASASSPGTISASPALTSSRRALLTRIQAACAADCGSKLVIRRSTSLARSSGGRLRACATRSSTGAVIPNLQTISARMPYLSRTHCGRGNSARAKPVTQQSDSRHFSTARRTRR